MRSRTSRVSSARGGLALALLVLLLALPPVALGAPLAVGAGPITGGGLLKVTTTLTLGPALGTHLNSPFEAVVLTTAGLGPASAAALGRYLNSTPFAAFRVGGGLDSYDPTTGLSYEAPPGGGRYVPVPEQVVNLTWFKAWCDSQIPRCAWIGSLPAEQNNTALAVHFVRWYHNLLGLQPTYWQFGNEPDAWTHYGENLSLWSTTDRSNPSGLAYATMARNYIEAIRQIYPNDQFIGLEDNCACNRSLVANTTAATGRLISAMAYHSYPWANSSSTNLSQFFGALSGSRNITSTAAQMRALDGLGCHRCSTLPIELGEYNAGPVPVHSPFAQSYPGAPFLAASLIQAADANVSMFTIFELGSLYNSTNGKVYPEGLLYQRILENMTMGQDYSVAVHDRGLGGVEALLIENRSREALLVVNTNTTRALQLDLSSSVFPVGLNGSEWYWGPADRDPVATLGIPLPTSYDIGAEGILLLTNY
jgi:hypothetical protein